MRRKILKSLMLILITGVGLMAQPGSGNPPPEPGDPPTQVPIDGGIFYLIAAGGIYGIKKIRDQRIKK